MDINKLLDSNKRLRSIIERIDAVGGDSFLVGGSVRDMVMDSPMKDIDIEVHDLPLDALEKCLREFGVVRIVGKQFGVLRLDGLDVDWSLPRRDSKGRKPTVEIDPSMGIEEACKRRDLTINAMAINLETAELIDPYGGSRDIEKKVLRAVDNKLFYDDPLRFYRVIQFISRFEMKPDEELTEICKEIDLNGVARERIYDELKKMFLHSKRPSMGIRWLKDIGRLKEIMPELHDLIGVGQPEKHHPEGDVFEHSMQSLDASAVFDDYKSTRERLVIMFAALCHDLGKPGTTDKEFHAYGHDKAGVPIAKSFLKRFTDDSVLHDAVKKLVRYHLMPAAFLEQGSSLSAYKRLAKKLEPVTLRMLGIVALCDARGRNSLEESYSEFIEAYMAKVREAKVEHGAVEPVLKGRHLLDVVEPGKELGALLKEAYEIQIEENVIDVEELKRRVIKK